MKTSHHLLVWVHSTEYGTANFFCCVKGVTVGKMSVACRSPVPTMTEQLADQRQASRPFSGIEHEHSCLIVALPVKPS